MKGIERVFCTLLNPVSVIPYFIPICVLANWHYTVFIVVTICHTIDYFCDCD